MVLMAGAVEAYMMDYNGASEDFALVMPSNPFYITVTSTTTTTTTSTTTTTTLRTPVNVGGGGVRIIGTMNVSREVSGTADAAYIQPAGLNRTYEMPAYFKKITQNADFDSIIGGLNATNSTDIF